MISKILSTDNALLCLRPFLLLLLIIRILNYLRGILSISSLLLLFMNLIAIDLN
jgi:hypothetical protein